MALFLFKQKTAYELRISDWSSDVCSSDLVSARTAPSSGTSRAGVPTTHTTSAPTNHPTARPSSERAGTTALTNRWIGTNASSSAHQYRRSRRDSHGPDTVSTAASSAIQRGASRNWEKIGRAHV